MRAPAFATPKRLRAPRVPATALLDRVTPARPMEEAEMAGITREAVPTAIVARAGLLSRQRQATGRKALILNKNRSMNFFFNF